MSLNRVYPLHITLEQFILLHSKYIFFLPEFFQFVTASKQSVICQTQNCWMVALFILLGSSRKSESMLDGYVQAAG